MSNGRRFKKKPRSHSAGSQPEAGAEFRESARQVVSAVGMFGGVVAVVRRDGVVDAGKRVIHVAGKLAQTLDRRLGELVSQGVLAESFPGKRSGQKAGFQEWSQPVNGHASLPGILLADKPIGQPMPKDPVSRLVQLTPDFEPARPGNGSAKSSQEVETNKSGRHGRPGFTG